MSACSRGGTLVSTADHYAAGRSEFMIGRWLKTVDRSSVLIATKVGRHPDRPGLGRHQTENSVDASLERLGTDYVDFLSYDGDLLPDDPVEAFEAVDRLIRAGKVRFLSAGQVRQDAATRLVSARTEEEARVAEEIRIVVDEIGVGGGEPGRRGNDLH